MPHRQGVRVSVLEVTDLAIRFGGLQALADVSLNVREWEIVGLTGQNGAGKTTFFNCVMGVYKPTNGSVTYRGAQLIGLPTHRRVTMGIGRTFQNIGLVKVLPVIENMLIAQHAKANYGVLPSFFGTP